MKSKGKNIYKKWKTIKNKLKIHTHTDTNTHKHTQTHTYTNKGRIKETNIVTMKKDITIQKKCL